MLDVLNTRFGAPGVTNSWGRDANTAMVKVVPVKRILDVKEHLTYDTVHSNRVQASLSGSSVTLGGS